MYRKQKFYKCDVCGNIVGVINNTGIPMECCNRKMEELIPTNLKYSYLPGFTSQLLDISEDAKSPSQSKVFRIKKDENNNEVSVIVDRKYVNSNSICWAYLKTEQGGQRKNLDSEGSSILNFKLVDDTPISAYFYCSEHGLFRMDF